MYWVGVGMVCLFAVLIAASVIGAAGWRGALIIFAAVAILSALFVGGLFLMAKYD